MVSPYQSREIEILKDLAHSNIIALKDPRLYHSVDDAGDDCYRFVLECMDEELYEHLHDPHNAHPRPLTKRVLDTLRPQRLPIEEVKNIVWQIGSALQYMHSKNMCVECPPSLLQRCGVRGRGP